MKKNIPIKMLLVAACLAFAVSPAFAQDTRYNAGTTNTGRINMLATDTVPVGAAKGTLYYDLSENLLKSHNGSAFVAVSASGTGDNTLDQAYDQGGAGAGRAITVDTGAVALSNTDADTAFLLTLNAAPGSSAALGGIEITVGSNSTENGIEFENTGSGDDVQGTGDTWAVTKAGVITGDSLIATGGASAVSFNATTSSITLTSDGDADDLTVSVAGANNVSLILSSTGTAADALQITTTAGGIDILNGGAAGGEDIDVTSTSASINLTAGESAVDSVVITSSIGGIDILAAGAAAGEDIDIVATGSSVNITSTEASADAVVISASTAVGGIDITSQADIDITTTGTAGEDISLTNTGGSVVVTATEAVADAIVLNASTALGGIDITSNADIDITTTGAAGEDITISNTGGSVAIASTETVKDSVSVQTSGGVDVDAVDDIVITVASTTAGDDLSLVQTGAVNSSILLTAAGTGVDAIGLTASAGSVTLTSSANINLTATDDVVIPADVGVTFGTGEKIEGDSTDLTITSGGALNLTATTDVVVPTSVGVTFGTGEKIEGDDTDLTITSGADIGLTATADVNLPVNVGLTFGDDGEKIEGDGTDLTISGNNINLTGTADIVIPANVGITFGTGEKIEGDNTDLTVTSGALINLTATTDVAIPVNVGILMAGTEKIESDGTDITITVGAAGDINIGTDIGLKFADDGEGIEGDGDDLTVVSGRDIILTPTSSINMSVAIELASGTTTKLNSDFQPELQSVAFDVEEAVLDADDGTGIKIESIDLNFDGKITRAWVDITQGCADASDTCELFINDTDNATSPTTTIVAAQDCAAASLLAFNPSSSTTVPLATISATERFVVVLYKDVGNDGSTGANLQGVLYVEYVRN